MKKKNAGSSKSSKNNGSLNPDASNQSSRVVLSISFEEIANLASLSEKPIFLPEIVCIVPFKFTFPSDQPLADLPEEDRQWAVQINTNSRKHAIKVAAALGRAITQSNTGEKPLSIGVEGPPNSGKALICDVILFEILDNHNAYQVPNSGYQYLESEPDEGFKKTISKDFKISGALRTVTFKNYQDVLPLKAKNMKTDSYLSLISYNTSQGKIDITANGCDHSMFIRLTGNISGTSEWIIYVTPDLRTPEIRECLEHLKIVSEKIKMRHLDTPQKDFSL